MPASRRAVIYAHHHPAALVRPYVEHHLRHLGAVCDRLLFVSSTALSPREVERAGAHADTVILRENEGLDFGSWQRGLAELRLDDVDELVLTNSSLVGPVRPLAEVFAQMEPRECDFWGLTEGLTPLRHLQSYFLVFRRRALRSAAFQSFWSSVLPYREKAQVVLSYEVGLSRFLIERGLRPGVLFPYESVMSEFYGRWPRLRGRPNQAYTFAAFLLQRGMPYVKIEALRGVAWHPRPLALHRLAERMRIGSIRRELAREGFDLDLLEDEGPPRPPTLR